MVADDERNLEYLRAVDHVCDIDAGCGGGRDRPGVGNAPISCIDQTGRRVDEWVRLDDGAPRVVYGGDEGGAVAAVIAQPVNVDLIRAIASLVIDFELNSSPNSRADIGREALDLC